MKQSFACISLLVRYFSALAKYHVTMLYGLNISEMLILNEIHRPDKKNKILQNACRICPLIDDV